MGSFLPSSAARHSLIDMECEGIGESLALQGLHYRPKLLRLCFCGELGRTPDLSSEAGQSLTTYY